MSWEKLPFLGGLAALLLTAVIIRAIFIVPDFDGWFWDVYIILLLGILDFYLVTYKNSPYWKPVCIGIIVFSVAVLVWMHFYPKEAGAFLQPWFLFGV